MWARFVLICCLVGTIGAARAEPLDWLTKDQKIALGQLIGGYTESLICKKAVDLDVAGKFLQQKLGGEKFAPEQIAQMFHMVIGLHAMQMGDYLKNKPSEQSTSARCKKIYDDVFGPKGRVIPGLLN
jgi:hypothetical protein